MYSFFTAVRKETEDLIRRTRPEGCRWEPDMDCPLGEVSAPLGYGDGPGEGWLKALEREIAAEPPLIDGVPLIECVEEINGHVVFHITSLAYSSAVAHIIMELPLPPMPESTGDAVSYALARMIMLSRKEGNGCPDVPAVKRALWLTFATEFFQGKKRAAIAKRAAEALISMADRPEPPGSRSVRDELGEAGRCAAALLWTYALKGG